MIWVGGRVVSDKALKVSVFDRTFEHGLGLFETLRTYKRRAPLLGRHLTRLDRSARELGLPIETVELPDDRAVAALLDAEEVDGDVMLRITLTGGLTETLGAMLWMRSGPLPPPARHEGAVVDVGSWRVTRLDPLARHKALNYWARRLAYEAAHRVGFDEVLSMTLGSALWEGSRTNLFGVQGSTLVTPSLDGPLVPGVMRGLVMELAGEHSLAVKETNAFSLDLFQWDEVFLTNSVRGLIPVARAFFTTCGGDWKTWPAPGPWTQRLSILANDWLDSGGRST
jgi:branched-chain amino acid aminotransferase